MSQYHCECGQETSVIDTRPSFSRLRRRRKCPHNHRFSTVEVPLTARDELKKLLIWAIKDEDLISYAHSELDRILLGIQEPETRPPDDGS